MPPYLTADLGNSALKLIAWGAGGELLRRARFSCDDGLEQALTDFLAAAGELDGAALASVAAVATEVRVRALLTRVLCGRPPLMPDPGVHNACRSPETTGADRLFAVRGAHQLGHRAALILDAGTALTVDAFEVDPDGRPALLGGAIAPGPELLAAALTRGAARLPAIHPRPGAPALGRDTRTALEAGVVVGFQGAAAELARRVADEAGLTPDAPVLLSGGAAPFLADARLFPGRELLAEPELVHRGLLAAASASDGARP